MSENKQKVNEYYDGLMKEADEIANADKKSNNEMLILAGCMLAGYYLGRRKGFKRGSILGRANGYHDAIEQFADKIKR